MTHPGGRRDRRGEPVARLDLVTWNSSDGWSCVLVYQMFAEGVRTVNAPNADKLAYESTEAESSQVVGGDNTPSPPPSPTPIPDKVKSPNP
jgi:hypothetical protein